MLTFCQKKYKILLSRQGGIIMKESFGQRFQNLRKEKGLTQEDIAEKVNISAQAVSKWENDISFPDVAILLELAEMLGVSVDFLLGKKMEVQAQVSEKANKEEISKRLIRVRIISADKDKVNINLPLALLKLTSSKGERGISVIGGKTFSKADIDVEEIIRLAEIGVIGEIIDIESADGDTIKVTIE